MKKSVTYPDCWSDDRRMKVLFSPFRQRNVNPENYDGQMLFWKTQIRNFAKVQGDPQISLVALKNAFERNGEKPHCIPEVLSAMLANGEIKPLNEFLLQRSTSWSEWSINMLKKPLQMGTKVIREKVLGAQDTQDVVYVVMEVINSQSDAVIRTLKNQILNKSTLKERLGEWSISEDAFPLVLHELQRRQKLVTRHLHEDDPSSSHDESRIVIKFGTESHKAFPFTDMELAIHKLEFTEKDLLKMIGRMEEQVHEHEVQARRLLGEKKRLLAKNSLRKRDSTMKRLEKRVQCLENVQGLIQRIHDVTDDAAVLDAYRTGTKSLQAALSNSGITMDSVEEAIAEMKDAIELHEEVKSAIAGPMSTANEEAELEKELEELVKAEQGEQIKEDTKCEDDKPTEDDLINQLENLCIVTDPLPLVNQKKEVKESFCQ